MTGTCETAINDVFIKFDTSKVTVSGMNTHLSHFIGIWLDGL